MITKVNVIPFPCDDDQILPNVDTFLFSPHMKLSYFRVFHLFVDL